MSLQRKEISSQPFSARVGGSYYSYAKGYQEVVKVYDPSCLEYTPSPRFGHCACLVQESWYVLGGVGHHPLSLVEEYNIVHERWQQHKAEGDVPAASFGVACAALQGKIYTFGGCTSNGKYSNVLSELDLGGMIWRALKPHNPPHAPILKKDAAMTTCDKCLVTFGGYGVLHEAVEQSRAAYDKDSKKKPEVWTNELIKCSLDQSEFILCCTRECI